MIDIEYRLNKIEAKLNNIVRIGEVSSINETDCTVKVVFQEFDNSFVSHDLPIMVKQSMANKDYWLPDINEQVVCIFLPTGLENGFVLGSLYSEEDKPVLANPQIRNVTFSDGSSMTYDRKKHELNINIVNEGKLNIKANSANLTAKEITVKSEKATITANSIIEGDLTIKGNVKATGDISDKVSSLAKMRSVYNSHNHPNNGAAPPSVLM